MIKQINNLKRGFTLIETMVAVSIFSISILGLMSVLAEGISSTNYAKQKMVASYLAQEGVEYIRNMRDTFVLYSPAGPASGWNDFINTVGSFSGPDPCAGLAGCYFDGKNIDYTDSFQPMTALVLTPCPGPGPASCPELLYDNVTGEYTYTASANTVQSGFRRAINISFINTNDIKISSTISWTLPSGPQSIVFSEDVFNWVE